MPSKLSERVLATIRRYRMIEAGNRVGVGVSGGADSIALLLLLKELSSELGCGLLVVHFNHRLRGEESLTDERFVEQFAASLGLEFAQGSADVRHEAQKQRLNLEDAARRLRYGFFEKVVNSGRADRIAVGHTADDQAETVLARLVRGTGPAGLAGIYPVKDFIVRPLIEVRREELREMLGERGQEWREDASNEDVTRLRARIRHSLLPVLENAFQPAIVKHLGTLARLARVDEDYWNALTDEWFRRSVKRRPRSLAIDIQVLLNPCMSDMRQAGEAQKEAFAGRIIRRLVGECRGGRTELTAEHVETVLQLARGAISGRQIQLPGDVLVKRQFELLTFSGPANRQEHRGKETVGEQLTYEYLLPELPEKGATQLQIVETGKRLSLKVIDWSTASRDTRESREILDRDLLRPPLILRNWRPGDAYRPAGRRGVQKLKRLFLGRRVPVEERAGWPVLTSAGEVAWALGMPVAAAFAAQRDSRVGLLIAEEST